MCGKGKILGLRAALQGGFINELVIDEASASLLVEELERMAAAQAISAEDAAAESMPNHASNNKTNRKRVKQ